MKEKIIRIEEGEFKKSKDDYHTYSGYLVITDKQTIKLGIDLNQDCCENPGFFWSNDNVQDFIGARISSIEIVDTELNKERFDKEFEYGFSEGGIMFVNINTSKGILQFTAYNQQNGYYGHEAVVLSEQLNKEEYL